MLKNYSINDYIYKIWLIFVIRLCVFITNFVFKTIFRPWKWQTSHRVRVYRNQSRMWNEAANPVLQVLPNSWGGLPPRPNHSQHRVSSPCFTTKRSRSATLPETAFRSRVGHSSRPRRPRKISSQFVAFDVSDSRQRNVLNWRSDFLLFVRASTFFDLENWSPTSCPIAAFERCLQSDRRSARFRILQDSGRVKSDDTSLGKNPIRGVFPDRGSQA